MTEQQQPAAVVPFPVVPVTAAPGSRLEELLASYESAKAAAQEAADRFEAITDAIKNEMTAAAPNGTTVITLSGAPGLPQLKMTWKRPWRFDSKRFKAEHPRMYVQYEKQGGNWELRQES